MLPVRCFCGAVLGHKTEPYRKLCQEIGTPNSRFVDRGEVLDQLDILADCCRGMMLSSVDINSLTLDYIQSQQPIEAGPYYVKKKTGIVPEYVAR